MKRQGKEKRKKQFPAKQLPSNFVCHKMTRNKKDLVAWLCQPTLRGCQNPTFGQLAAPNFGHLLFTKAIGE